MSVKPLDSTDRDLGVTSKMEVTTSSGDLYSIDFWKTAADASGYASRGGGGYRAFGTITIDSADTTGAKKIETCFH